MVWQRRRARRARTGNIADTLDREHPSHFAWALDGMASGSGAQTAGVGSVQMAQEDVVKIDGPNTAADGFECHPIAGESLADEAESSLPFNLSAQVNAADWQVLGVTRGANAPAAAAALVLGRKSVGEGKSGGL